MIPMPSISILKALAVAAILASTFGAGWQVNGWRIHSATQAEARERAEQADQENRERAAQSAQAERENRTTESRRSTNVIEAINAQTHRAHILQAAAADSRTAANSLRDELNAARHADHADLPRTNGDASADHASSADRLLDAMEAGVTRLSERGAEIARAANGHASDTLTLQQAWPK